MLRFLGRIYADFWFKSEWIGPLQVGGNAPFSPDWTNKLYQFSPCQAIIKAIKVLNLLLSMKSENYYLCLYL